jgi:hypothetical protein
VILTTLYLTGARNIDKVQNVIIIQKSVGQ